MVPFRGSPMSQTDCKAGVEIACTLTHGIRLVWGVRTLEETSLWHLEQATCPDDRAMMSFPSVMDYLFGCRHAARLADVIWDTARPPGRCWFPVREPGVRAVPSPTTSWSFSKLDVRMEDLSFGNSGVLRLIWSLTALSCIST